MGYERERKIVCLAADQIKTQPAKGWLRDDPHGKWERRARELLGKAARATTMATMGEDEVNGEVAAVLAFLGVEAALRGARKGNR